MSDGNEENFEFESIFRCHKLHHGKLFHCPKVNWGPYLSRRGYQIPLKSPMSVIKGAHPSSVLHLPAKVPLELDPLFNQFMNFILRSSGDQPKVRVWEQAPG